MRKMFAVAAKELRQIARDRRTLLIVLFVPAMFLLLFGYALNFDIRNVHLIVEDRDRSPQSRALVSAFVNPDYFQWVADVTSSGEIERLIDRNEARAALVIPAGYGRDLLARRPVQVQIIIDGTTRTPPPPCSAMRSRLSRRWRWPKAPRSRSARRSGWSRGSGTTPSFAARFFSFPA